MAKLDDSMSEKLELILKNWQERLIDVSKSNPLLGLNRSRAAKLEVASPDIKSLVKNLIEDNSVIKLPFVRKKAKKVIKDEDDKEVKENDQEYIFQAGDIDFIYSGLSDLRLKTRKIFDNSRLTLTERGVNTLYFAIGSLEWEDGIMGKSESPLIMIPCEFEYKGPSRALGLKMADGDIILNPALQYYLREREEIELGDIPDDFSYDKIDDFLRKIEDQTKLNGWTVFKKAWLGIFNFETLAIYQDLKLLNEQAKNSKLVQAIAHVGEEVIENLSLNNDLDSLETPQEVPISVVKSDSSQLRALTLAAKGANLVIHGPPGTGKSQTITSIIAHALGQKKRVLFVSAKMAALNVVHNRLQELNLGQYCLEAHGVKSGKKKVVDELKRTLELNDDIKIAKNLDEDLAKLIANRNKLNEYVRCLHDTNNSLGISLFSAYGKYEKLSNIDITKAPLPSNWQNLLEISMPELENALSVLNEVDNHSDDFSKRNEHPLRGMKIDSVDLITLERLERNLKKLISFCSEIQLIAKKLDLLFPKLDLRLPDLFSSVGFFNSLASITTLVKGWHKKSLSECESLTKEIIECQTILEEKTTYQNAFYSFTSRKPEDIIEIFEHLKNAYPHWYNKFNLQYLRDKKTCIEVIDKKTKANIYLVSDLSDKAKKILDLESLLGPKILKFGFTNEQSSSYVIKELEELKNTYETAKAIKIWAQETKFKLAENPKFGESESNNFAQMVDIINLNKQDIDNILIELNNFWPDGFYKQIKIDDVPLSEIIKISTLIDKSLTQSEVRSWQTTCRLIENCANYDLLPFLQNINKKSINNSSQIFEKRFYSLWIDALIHSKQILSEFSERSQEDLINKFRDLDEKIRKLVLINVVAEPAKIARQVKLAHSGFGNANGVGILRKEMEKRKRLKPLRVLFNEIPQVLQTLKPCFLMSPLSVSTFLKPGAFTFDLVIFDEASQLPTPEAIPSILRGKQVIVAGDSKQLPPTYFFRSNIVNDSGEWEDGQIEELESLLDDCKATVPFFQETDLRWHYRSRDERLINFSNHYYYDNRLITIPTPKIDSNSTGVVLEYVSDGIWDRGGSRINRKEARHTATLIIKHFKTEPSKSLGVVALNASQKEAIENALEEELLNNTDLLPFVDSEKNDAFFIKSLENVQGDERDVIMISIGYGKAQDGKMTLNFGPINNEGGWRRLNVLVTRAKWKTVLITSIRSAELSGINPENKGAMGLKNYIQYAETGFLNECKEAPMALSEETNDFEDSVKRKLELAGFKVDAQVGVGSFRIDLAVRNPKANNNYSIGIECDGASYHSSCSARDRDILRQEILQNMGWKIYRIWSTEWFRNREESIKLLIENVNRSIKDKSFPAKNNSVNVESSGESLISIPLDIGSVGTKYKKYTKKWNRKVVMKPNEKYSFANFIASIVSEEGPIHIDILMERIKDLTGVGRAGNNIQKNFDAALKIAMNNDDVEKNKEDKGFIYKVGENYSSFRVERDETHRQLNYISAIEIKNALLYLIQEQFGLAYDNLVQSIKPLFGIARIDPEESDRLKDIVDDMIDKGLIIKNGPLLNLSNKL